MVINATASNNLLKTACTYAFGAQRTANLAAPGMIGLALLSIVYAMIGLQPLSPSARMSSISRSMSKRTVPL